MTREGELWFGLMAVQMGIVTRDQLLDAAAAWLDGLDAAQKGPRAGRRTLARVLEDDRALDVEGRETVEASLEASEVEGGRAPHGLVVESLVRDDG